MDHDQVDHDQVDLDQSAAEEAVLDHRVGQSDPEAVHAWVGHPWAVDPYPDPAVHPWAVVLLLLRLLPVPLSLAPSW